MIYCKYLEILLMRIFSEAIKSFSAGKKCTELLVRLMFWTDWGASGKIERAGMDGSQRQVIAKYIHFGVFIFTQVGF